MASSLAHLEPIDTPSALSRQASNPNLSRKLTIPSSNHTPGSMSELHIKYHDKLMKPLQSSQKRRLVLLSNRALKAKDAINTEIQYDDLMTKVDDLKRISELHDKTLKGIRSHRLKTETPENDGLLRDSVNERVYRCIKLARENSLGQLLTDNTSYQLPTLTFDLPSESVERGVKQEEKQKRLASNLSNPKDRKTPKQLNNNAHFRHASRKILLLRAQDSAVNQQEALKGLFSDVKLCSEIDLDPCDSPLRSKRSLSSQRREKEPMRNTITTQPRDNSYSIPMPPSVAELVEKELSPVEGSPTLGTWLNLPAPFTTTHKDINGLRSLTWDENVQNVPKDVEYFDNQIEFDKSPIKARPRPDTSLKLNRVATFDTFRSLNNESQSPLKSKRSVGQGDAERSPRFDRNASRVSKANQRLQTEYQEQKGHRVKTEIKLSTRTDSRGAAELAPVSSINKILRSTKSFHTLKHIRQSSSNFFTGRTLESERGSKSPSKIKQLKVKRTNMDNESPSSGVYRTVQDLIDRSYGDSPEKEPGVKDMAALLNSYGFEDTIGQIRTSRPKFSSLEGYQKQFFKDTVAKTERFVDRALKRNNKDLTSVK